MNIILIDDEEVAVNALKRRMDWKKYGADQVYIANSMKQAQQMFREQTIDVMICDIEMPQGSGLDLFEWVKAYHPAVECVYVTCHPEFSYMRKALQLGSADYILKPIDYAELDKVLTQLTERIGRRRSSRSIPKELLQHAADRQEDKSDVISTVKRYVQAHIQEDIYIADIAREVYLNEQYLMRSFKRSTGMSILEYITSERLQMAKVLLLETDLPIKRVADAVGYGNYSYFTKLFKRNIGLAPQDFRQEHGGTAKKAPPK